MLRTLVLSNKKPPLLWIYLKWWEYVTQEFQMTPYQWKKAKLPLMITEKLSLAHIQEMADGNLMMPSFVLLPDMQFAGRKHTMGFVQSHTEAPMHALQFWQEEQQLINDGVEPGVYYGITMNYQKENKYLTIIQVYM